MNVSVVDRVSKLPFAVECIRSERDIEKFIRFGWSVYRDNPFWVPPPVGETKKFLLGKTLFSKHCRHRLFVLKENQKIQATLAAFYDENYIHHWKKKIGVLGFFETLPDRFDGIRELFQSAESYLIREGAEVIQAPVNGNIANPAGLLMNAYDQMPVFLMAYHPDYYQDYFNRLGYHPARELLALTLDLRDSRLRRKVDFVIRRAQTRSELQIRSFDTHRFNEDAKKLARIYAQTFKHHWGYTPQTDQEVLEFLNSFKSLMVGEFILFAEHKGEVVGFLLTAPDYNPIFKKLNGNINLFNLPYFLYHTSKIREARMIAMGVTSEWRGKNVASLLVASACKAYMNHGYTKCEYSWVLKENVSSLRVAEKFNATIYRKYTIFEKQVMN